MQGKLSSRKDITQKSGEETALTDVQNHINIQ
jgi:hypothetical protein